MGKQNIERHKGRQERLNRGREREGARLVRRERRRSMREAALSTQRNQSRQSRERARQRAAESLSGTSRRGKGSLSQGRLLSAACMPDSLRPAVPASPHP